MADWPILTPTFMQVILERGKGGKKREEQTQIFLILLFQIIV